MFSRSSSSFLCFNGIAREDMNWGDISRTPWGKDSELSNSMSSGAVISAASCNCCTFGAILSFTVHSAYSFCRLRSCSSMSINNTLRPFCPSITITVWVILFILIVQFRYWYNCCFTGNRSIINPFSIHFFVNFLEMYTMGLSVGMVWFNWMNGLHRDR